MSGPGAAATRRSLGADPATGELPAAAAAPAPAAVAERLAALRRGLRELDCSALLVLASSAADPDLAPFAEPAHVHGCFLLAPQAGEPRFGYLTPMERDEAAATGLALLTPEALDVARWAREGAAEEALLAGVLSRALQLAAVPRETRLALGGRTRAGLAVAVAERLGAEGWRFAPAHDLLLRLRKRKSAGEIAAERVAAAGTMAAFRRVAALLAAAVARDGELWLGGERLRAGHLRSELASELAARGLAQPEGNIVAAGADGGVPHTAGADDRVLRPHESLVVDLYPRGFVFADCTRTFCVGTPPEPLRAAHAAVLAALADAHRGALPGASAWALQERVCSLLASHGWPTPISDPGTTRGYVHGLGHGVGFELHEYPSFRRHAGEEGVLAAGDLLTLEPGLYEPGFYEPEGGAHGFGVRLEDLVALGEQGAENLTPLPYDLDPRAW